MTTISPKLHFTVHANVRITERCTLSSKEIAQLVHHEVFTRIGMDLNKKNVCHYLLFSVVDNAFFVLVMDERKRTLITVLPGFTYKNWVIDFALFEQVKNQMLLFWLENGLILTGLIKESTLIASVECFPGYRTSEIAPFIEGRLQREHPQPPITPEILEQLAESAKPWHNYVWSDLAYAKIYKEALASHVYALPNDSELKMLFAHLLESFVRRRKSAKNARRNKKNKLKKTQGKMVAKKKVLLNVPVNEASALVKPILAVGKKLYPDVWRADKVRDQTLPDLEMQRTHFKRQKAKLLADAQATSPDQSDWQACFTAWEKEQPALWQHLQRVIACCDLDEAGFSLFNDYYLSCIALIFADFFKHYSTLLIHHPDGRIIDSRKGGIYQYGHDDNTSSIHAQTCFFFLMWLGEDRYLFSGNKPVITDTEHYCFWEPVATFKALTLEGIVGRSFMNRSASVVIERIVTQAMPERYPQGHFLKQAMRAAHLSAFLQDELFSFPETVQKQVRAVFS
jgi:hypothetical protein